MKTCTFIGHKNASEKLEPILKLTIETLVLKGITKFYVGTHGSFDNMVQKILTQLKLCYPQIRYYVVLAYLPKTKADTKDYFETIYPDGLEKVPLRFAITERNKWMIKNSDYLVCYVNNPFSNANKFKEFAIKKGKQIINLQESNEVSI